jgi:hypothetical protein
VQRALLDDDVNAAVRVYAIWFNAYPGDARNRWRPDLLSDSRVVHFWDEGRSVGRLYFKTLPHIAGRRARQSQDPEGGVLWDAYLLYRSDARWDNQPPDVVSWGSTILLTRDTLSRDLFGLLARPH